MIDFFQTLNIKRFVFSDGDNVNNPKEFIDFLHSKNYLNLETQVVCFLGANQNQNTWYNNAIKYVQTVEKSSAYNITPIRILTEGKNALDMVLATYIGLSMRENAIAEFIIVSNDKGYDSVVNHFASLGISIKRETIRGMNQNQIEKEQNKKRLPFDDMTIEKLRKQRPKTRKAIKGILKTLKQKFNDENIEELVTTLSQQGIITVDDNDKIKWK